MPDIMVSTEEVSAHPTRGGSARVSRDRLPPGDLYERALADVQKMTGSLPPAPKRREASKPVPKMEPEPMELSDDELIPVKEEIPELPPYSDTFVEMVEEALARSTPAPAPRRAPTLPPPPPFNPLRAPTLPGYPPLARTETRPFDPPEGFGGRARSEALATVGHVVDHLEETRQAIAHMEAAIKQHVSDEISTLRHPPSTPPPPPRVRQEYSRLREPVRFAPPPSRASWLASIGKGIASKVKGWFAKKEVSMPEKKEEADLGRTLRLLEEAERDARDVPTAFLAGRSLDGTPLTRSTLDASKQRWERNAADLQAQQPSTTAIVEQRRSSITNERGSVLQKLLESDRHAFDAPIDPELTTDFLVLEKELPKHIRTLDALRVSPDPKKRAVAEQSLQALKIVAGGGSLDDLTKRTVLTCEAALRLPLAEVDEAAKRSLASDYMKRLERMHKALGLQGRSKEALSNIYRELTTVREARPASDMREAA